MPWGCSDEEIRRPVSPTLPSFLRDGLCAGETRLTPGPHDDNIVRRFLGDVGRRLGQPSLLTLDRYPSVDWPRPPGATAPWFRQPAS